MGLRVGVLGYDGRWWGWRSGGQVAQQFMYRAFEQGYPAVLWLIRLDPRGAADIVYRCKQVA